MRRPNTGVARRAGFRGVGGGAPAVAPVIAGPVVIGGTPGITAGTVGALYALYRDGVIVGGATDDLTLAQANAYVYVAADANESAITWEEYAVTAGTGLQSNALAYSLAQHWGNVWDPADAASLTLADGDTTVDAIADLGADGIVLAAPTSSQRPLYNAVDADFGGYPSMTFDGADNVLVGVLPGTQRTAQSVMMALRMEAGSINAGGFVEVGVGTIANGYLTLQQLTADATARARLATGPTNVESTSTTQVGEGSEQWYGFTWNGATPTQSIWRAGAAADTDAAVLTTIPATAIRVGHRLSGSSIYNNITVALVVADASDVTASAALAHLDAVMAYRYGL